MAGRKRTVSNKDILRSFEDTSDPVLSTSELAEIHGFSSNSGMLKRLVELEELGYLERKTPGRSSVWWLTEEGRAYLDTQNEEGPRNGG